MDCSAQGVSPALARPGRWRVGRPPPAAVSFQPTPQRLRGLVRSSAERRPPSRRPAVACRAGAATAAAGSSSGASFVDSVLASAVTATYSPAPHNIDFLFDEITIQILIPVVLAWALCKAIVAIARRASERTQGRGDGAPLQERLLLLLAPAAQTPACWLIALSCGLFCMSRGAVILQTYLKLQGRAMPEVAGEWYDAMCPLERGCGRGRKPTFQGRWASPFC